ncbi:hypothetical protein C1I95_24755 [Micromonospora craterilacus]|uniref:Uncharacterized protein n=1 Tax=Micromonospora craterilacus TaxID=1655439 RepID=A0A2W2DLY3_9ACTN|nr:hypothetical protein [Micromonospora craterilacus]PZG12956.1 hypothetical protein C1I95_24755 [Micromonospora craterilacus]
MTDIADWVREEQDLLWSDLNEAINRAIDGTWSQQAAGIARRIVEAARLVGPTEYGEVGWSLLAGGVYEAVLTAGGITPVLPDGQGWRRFDAVMAGSGGTRAALSRRYAGTVAAINTPREQNWINGGDE